MISVASGTAFLISSQDFGSGLVGSIGVTLYDDLGNVVLARSTSNIRELVAGSGVYQKRITTSLAAGFYLFVWDDAGLSYAAEELEVTP